MSEPTSEPDDRPIQRLEEALMFVERRTEDLEARIDALEQALRAAVARITRLEAAHEGQAASEAPSETDAH